MARRGRQGENSALPEKPSGLIDVLRTPTNITSVFARSFAAHTAESKARARAVLNQIGIVAQSRDQPGPLRFDCEASARNKVFPPGLTAEMVAADPDMLRARPVDPSRFWDQLAKALELNPSVSADDAPMAAQARTLLALRSSDPAWRALLDRAALAADAELHDSTRYDQIGVDAGNGWQARRTPAPGLGLVRPRAGGDRLHLRQRLPRGDLLHARHRRQGRAAARTLPLHGDVSEGRAAAGGPRPRRLLVADDVRPRLLHAREELQWPHQHRHGEPRRRRAEVRRRRLADTAPVARVARGQGRAGQLAARTRRPVRALAAHLRALASAARRQLPAAESDALQMSSLSDPSPSPDSCGDRRSNNHRHLGRRHRLHRLGNCSQ